MEELTASANSGIGSGKTYSAAAALQRSSRQDDGDDTDGDGLVWGNLISLLEPRKAAAAATEEEKEDEEKIEGGAEREIREGDRKLGSMFMLQLQQQLLEAMAVILFLAKTSAAAAAAAGFIYTDQAFLGLPFGPISLLCSPTPLSPRPKLSNLN